MAIVVVLLVGAVGLYALTPRSASTPAGSPGDLSPYDQLRAQIGPNGEVTKEMALEAFSLAIAPLPGVTVPTGAPANVDQQADATFAVMWIMRYLDQLTPEQHAVVDPILAPEPGRAAYHSTACRGSVQPRFVLAGHHSGRLSGSGRDVRTANRVGTRPSAVDDGVDASRSRADQRQERRLARLLRACRIE